MSSNYGTPNQSRVMTGNHGTPPPAHMASRLPNQPRAMAFNHGASNFHNHFQPIAGNHETQAFEPFYSRNPSMHSSESSAIVGVYQKKKKSAIVGNSETSIQKLSYYYAGYVAAGNQIGPHK
uniref:Uncharacterized protein n=1 Tax=Quercus lobata TaxID=97700 RepID=A0A7N2KKG2_QUELO